LRLADAAAREQALGDLFTTLGHLTHLVADVSVPEHSRNDAHLLRNYESWCVENLTGLDNMIHGIQVFQPAFEPGNAIFAQDRAVRVSDNAIYSPVSNLWDSHVDPGYNARLGDSPNAPRLYGLADYSNFNYFSNDTVFKDYAYPSREEVGLGLIPRVAPDGQTDYVLYFNRNTSDGVPVRHLAATDLVFLDSQAPLDNSLRYEAAHLDDSCYEEYASNLVPRAVSYGTALVDYFFRGKFEASGSGNTLTVTNRSTGTATGTFAVYRDDPADGLRKPVPGLENLTLAESGLGSGSTTTFTVAGFSPPSSTDNLLLVFTGTIWNEGSAPNADPAVAGKAFSWTGPPSPSLPPKIYVGDNPRGIAVSPNGRKLYVTNASENTVSVIDLTTGVEIRRITGVGPTPVDVAFTPDSAKAFVTNEVGRSVSVIDAVNDNVIGKIIGLAPNPEEVAVTPDGRYAYVAHWSFSPVTRIDTSDFSAVRILSPQRPLQGIALHPVESLTYVTYYTFYWGQAVGVLDNDSRLQATWSGPDLNWSAALAFGNRYLFVANPRDGVNTVTAYDTLTGQTAAILPGGGSPRGVAASPDGSRVYVANLTGDSVTVIDASSLSIIDTIPAGDGAYDVALSPDGRYLFVSNVFEDSVSVIRLSSGGTAAGQPEGFSMMAMTPAVPEESSWGTVLLTGFPAGGRVTVDGEFPRHEAFVEGGYAVSFPAGTRTLNLSYPDYPERTIPVVVGSGETVSVDGQMSPE